MKARAALALACLVLAPAAQGQDELAGVLSDAIDAYARALDSPAADERSGAFRRAERGFARAVELGARNADVYVDWGNAALQAERLGPAVLAYRRALQLDPDHVQARANLRHARALQPEWVPRPPEPGVLDSFFFWHTTWSPGERAFASGLAFALAALLVGAALAWGARSARGAAALPALAWLALLASLGLDAWSGDAPPAVVVVPEVVARSADSHHAPPRFAQPLPGGVEVTVRERRPGWIHAGLANGRDAWLPDSAVELVSPTSARR